MARQTTIDHVIIAVRDLAQATQDYSVLLGRHPSWQGPHPDHGTANALFKLDNIYIELLAATGEGMAADVVKTILTEQGQCLGGLVFGTPQAETFITHAKARGLGTSDPVPGHGRDQSTGAERHWRNIFWDPSAARGIFSFCIEHDPASSLPDAMALADGPVSGVDHVIVRTHSADAAKRFYGNQLGIRLALEQEVPEWGGTQLFFRASSMSIEVIASEKTGEQDDLWGIAFKTADIDLARNRLAAGGVAVSSVRDGRKFGTRVCTVKSHVLDIPTLLVEHTR